jgi:hypothetical protein
MPPPGQTVTHDLLVNATGDAPTRSDAHLDGPYAVTQQYYPLVDGQTNPAVTARVVGPLLPPGYQQPVLFSADTKEVLLASLNTNHNCFLNGRLYRLDAGLNAFYVTPSTPLGTNAFSAQSALEFGKRAFPVGPEPGIGGGGPYPLADHALGGRVLPGRTNAFIQRALKGRGAGGPGVLVDVDPLLSQLQPPPDKAGILGLTDVAIGPQGTNLAVTFKLHCTCSRLVTKRQGSSVATYPSFTQPVCDGTVVLDQALNVLSMTLNEPGK